MKQPEVNYRVALEVASHEALIRQAYKDSIGKLTWAVGMTSATGHAVARYIGNPQSIQHCMNIYAWALTKYAAGVCRAFAGVQLTEAQFAAALSFHWNTGAIGRASWVKKFKAGDITGAHKAFVNWRSPPEILGRRKKERALFFDGVWSNKGTMTEYTRLTSRMTPVWRSAIKINVAAELRNAFARIAEPILDTAPQPDSTPGAPTSSPVHPIMAFVYWLISLTSKKDIEQWPG